MMAPYGRATWRRSTGFPPPTSPKEAVSNSHHILFPLHYYQLTDNSTWVEAGSTYHFSSIFPLHNTSVTQVSTFSSVWESYLMRQEKHGTEQLNESRSLNHRLVNFSPLCPFAYSRHGDCYCSPSLSSDFIADALCYVSSALRLWLYGPGCLATPPFVPAPINPSARQPQPHISFSYYVKFKKKKNHFYTTSPLSDCCFLGAWILQHREQLVHQLPALFLLKILFFEENWSFKASESKTNTISSAWNPPFDLTKQTSPVWAWWSTQTKRASQEEWKKRGAAHQSCAALSSQAGSSPASPSPACTSRLQMLLEALCCFSVPSTCDLPSLHAAMAWTSWHNTTEDFP